MSELFKLIKFLLRIEFRSPFPYLIAAGCWFPLGYLFALQLEQNPTATLSTPIWWAAFLSLFLCPLLAMDVFYKKDRPDFFLLLRTLCVAPWKIVLSYTLIRFALLLLVDLTLIIQSIYLLKFGNPDFYPLISALFGLILLQVSYLSLSLLCASVLESSKQVFFASFCLLFFSWLLYYSPHILTNELSSVGLLLREFSLYKHFHRFLLGAFFEHDLIFVLGFPIVTMYLTTVAVKK